MNTQEITRLAEQANRYASGQTDDRYDWQVIRDEHFAHLVRNAALEEAALATGLFAQKWWSIYCDSNKHMQTTRKAHHDFCALQSTIRKMKENSNECQ